MQESDRLQPDTTADTSWDALTRPGEASDYFPLDPIPDFDTEPQAFSIENAWWLCEFSRLIYRMETDEIGDQADGLTRDAVLRSVGWRESRFINSGDIQCALFQTFKKGKPASVVIFRGTTGFRNWLLDLDAWPVDWPPGGRVHRGFTDALAQIWPELETALSLEATGTLFFCGHSLGGALAMLAASMRMPDAVYVFGAPRVGDRTFCQTIEPDRAFNISNGRDIVPSLPPALKAVEFESPGTLMLINPTQGLQWIGKTGVFPDAEPADRPFLSASLVRRRWYDPPDFLSDHAPVNYRLSLERVIREQAL